MEKDIWTYSGESKRCLGVPLGGIGTGQISFCGDGSLRQWEIFNHVNHDAYIPGSFFAIRIKPIGIRKEAFSKILITDEFVDSDFNPTPYVNDYLVPDDLKRLKKELPCIKDNVVKVNYPIVECNFIDDIYVNISLTAFSPMIPLDQKASSIPGIMFDFSLENTSGIDVKIKLLASQQNAVGYKGILPINDLLCDDYGGNINSKLVLDGLTTLFMKNLSLSERDQGYGNMVLSVEDNAAEIRTEWTDLNLFWKEFSAGNNITDSDVSRISKKGSTINGALSVEKVIKRGDTQHIIFYLAWYFPNQYRYWKDWYVIDDRKTNFYLGHEYNKRFKSSIDVLNYIKNNRVDLENRTKKYSEAFFNSTIPPVILDRVSSQSSILRSPTCMWLEDGKFYGFEGSCGESTKASIEPEVPEENKGGCAPLNCTHVWNYEMALASLFPELERTMRETDLIIQMDPSGMIPHRTVLPLYLPRLWDRDIGGPDKPALDGMIGTVLKTYREHRMCSDSSWLNKIWPKVKKLMDYFLEIHDPGKKGVIEGEQPHTYDVSAYGLNTFIGSLYLAALRAAEEMAQIVGEETLSKLYREIFERGKKTYDEKCFNGEYYIQVLDEKKYKAKQWGSGCFANQLLGQWWAHILDLGYVLPEEHVKKALKSIFKYNFINDFTDFVHDQRIYACGKEKGIVNCTWPNGDRPADPLSYCDEVWSGVEHALAGHMFFEGLFEEATAIVQAIRDRHDGTKRNPFNEIEAGDHYVRAMSSWAYLFAFSGWRYEGPRHVATINPSQNHDNFKSLFIASEGWGVFQQKITEETQEITIDVIEGKIDLQKVKIGLNFKFVDAMDPITEITLSNEKILHEHVFKNNFIDFILNKVVSVNKDTPFTIKIRFFTKLT